MDETRVEVLQLYDKFADTPDPKTVICPKTHTTCSERQLGTAMIIMSRGNLIDKDRRVLC